MKESKKHLDINLEFLDKKEPVRVTPKTDVPKEKEGDPNWRYYDANKAKANATTGRKWNWKNILIIGGVILFFLWIIFSDNNSSTSTNNPSSYNTSSVKQTSSNNTYIIGEYKCSKYNYDKSVELAPAETKQQLNITRDALKYKSNELNRLKSEIDNSHISKYSSQYEINQYNKTVNEYNSKLALYKRDAENFSSRIDKYNAQVEVHNNYLKNNCTLNR